jgi:hypothetical protein
MAAPRHCFAVGMGLPRNNCQPNSTAPATMNRVPTMKKGAKPSMATLMAKYVVPHTM